MKRFFQFIPRYKKSAVLALCAVAAGVFFLLRPHHAHPPSTNPNIINPVFAVEFLQTLNPQSLYFTLSSRAYLAVQKPAWISAHDAPQDLLDFYHAGEDPVLWRKLDHQFHFDTVMLCGDPSEYNPLLEHLIVSKDFTLVYLDHTSVIFKRSPARLWDPGDLNALAQKFAGSTPIDRASFLTQSASKLLAVAKADRSAMLNDLAKHRLDDSLGLDKDSPDTWTQMALYDLQSNRPNEALADTDRALGLDENYYYALTARVRVLYFMKRFVDALHVSQHLLETQKDDPSYPNVLMFHARIAHEAHAYTEEIDTLKHLINIIVAQNQPVAGFRVYLGQAYEMDGQAQPALLEFHKALDEGTLGDDQTKAVNMTIQSIESQTSH